MSNRALLILFVIALGLSLHVRYFERTKPPWASQGRVFPDLEPSEIQEIEVERADAPGDAAAADARMIRLRFEGDPPEWWVVEPIRFEASHPRVQGIAWDIADMTRVADVPPGSAAFSAGPRATLRFKTRRGESHTIELGADHPDPRFEFAYVRVDGSAFVTPKEFRKSVWVTLHDVRSRALFGITSSEAGILRIDGEARFEKTLERDGASERWRLRKPIDAQADREVVEELLRDLNAWAASTFASDRAVDAASLSTFGLAHPRAAIELSSVDGKRTVRVEVGEAVADSNPPLVYVRQAGQPFVMAAPAEPLKKAFGRPEEFRSRYLFDMGLEDVDELTGEWDGVKVVIRKAKESTKDKPAFVVDDPRRNESFPGDAQVIGAQVTILRKLLIQEFRSEAVSTPRGSISLRLGDGRVLSAAFGPESRAPDEKDLNLHTASVPGEPGACLVSTPLPELLKEGPSAFRRRDISSLDASRLVEIRVIDGGQTWDLARPGGEAWTVSEDTPVPEGKFDPKKVSLLLLLLEKDRFRVARYLPDATDFAALGLELALPRRALALLRFEGESPTGFRKLVLGEAVKGSSPVEVMARVDLPEVPVFTLEESVSKAFDALVQHLHEITGK